MGAIPHNVVLLDGVTATGAGRWVAFTGWRNPSVEVDGIVVGDVVQIQVTNAKDPDAAGAQILQQDADITEDSLVGVDPGAAWIRANVSAVAGGGTITVRLTGIEYT